MLVSKSSIISNARMWTRHELPGEQQVQRSSIAVQCSKAELAGRGSSRALTGSEHTISGDTISKLLLEHTKVRP